MWHDSSVFLCAVMLFVLFLESKSRKRGFRLTNSVDSYGFKDYRSMKIVFDVLLHEIWYIKCLKHLRLLVKLL